MRSQSALSIAFSMLVSVLVVVGLEAVPASAADCSSAYVTGQIALTDLPDSDPDTYQGEAGGLYPGGSNSIPSAHLELGIEQAADVVPRASNGAASASGKIGFLSVGVSNTAGEFKTFMGQPDSKRDSSVVLVNGAQGGAPVSDWVQPEKNAWDTVAERITDAGLSAQQVQVVWVKLPERNPDEAFPADARTYADDLTSVLQAVHTNYPNVKLAYVSSRIYGGYGDDLNPEPWAYQHGFGVKWTIEAQIEGDSSLNPDPSNGTVRAPWTAWGPYMWANGLGPDLNPGGEPGRSDGLEWLCEDFQSDGIHPSEEGAVKVASLLTEFLHNDETACLWYLADDSACEQPDEPTEPAGSALPFVDIAGSQFIPDIEWLAAERITLGCNPPVNDRFCPDDPVTRGQMAAFLTRALDLPPGPDRFTDDETSVFEGVINSLAHAGITLGCNPPVNDRFCPDDPVTRGQMAAFLTRALDLPPGPDRFTDDESSTFEGVINSIAQARITLGCNPPTNDHFCPTELVTREQMAAFLHRASAFFE